MSDNLKGISDEGTSDPSDDLHELLSRLVPTSSIMPFHEAKKVAAAFGNLVVELADIKRYSLHDLEKGLPYSLPVEKLRRSKQDIQTALAIVVAELAVELALRESHQVRVFLNAAVECSGDLAWFTREPAGPTKHMWLQTDSVSLYVGWQTTCERYLEKIAGRRPPAKDARWPGSEALAEYWRSVDRRLPDLLDDPILIAIRAT